MNEYVKSSIDARKESFYTAYEITDKDIEKKIEELFKKIYEFGESCSDAMDFENKFQSSELNSEYINMFTEVATKCKAKNIQSESNTNVKSTSEQIADEISSDARYYMNEATMPMRRKARQEMYDEMRDVPIVGDAMNIKQHVDFFGRFKRKKDDE